MAVWSRTIVDKHHSGNSTLSIKLLYERAAPGKRDKKRHCEVELTVPSTTQVSDSDLQRLLSNPKTTAVRQVRLASSCRVTWQNALVPSKLSKAEVPKKLCIDMTGDVDGDIFARAHDMLVAELPCIKVHRPASDLTDNYQALLHILEEYMQHEGMGTSQIRSRIKGTARVLSSSSDIPVPSSTGDAPLLELEVSSEGLFLE